MDSDRMKPIIILPPETMSAADIQALRDNGLCVVEAKEPSRVTFLDPIPSAAERTKVEEAAIALSRKILSRDYWATSATGQLNLCRGDISRAYIDLLVAGTRLDPSPSRAEQEQKIFDDARRDEIATIAREEAREERRLAKEVKEAEKKAAAEAKKAKKETP